MSADILIGFFFDGKDIALTASRQADFILAAGGFIDRFEGRGPASAHTALPPILSGHFDRRLQILREVLNENQVPTDAIETWVQFEEGFREVVVTL
jgi:hemoglobin